MASQQSVPLRQLQAQSQQCVIRDAKVVCCVGEFVRAET